MTKLTAEDKLRKLDLAKSKLNAAIENIFDAGQLYDDALLSVSVTKDRFMDLRHSVTLQISEIEGLAKATRIQNETETKPESEVK